MAGHRFEVPIRCQKLKTMPDGQSRQKRIDRPDLNAASATLVPQSRGFDVILHLGHDDGQERKLFQDSVALPRALEALKQLLDHQPRGHDQVSPLQAPFEHADFRSGRRGRAPQRQRPDARVDENIHDRERSAL